MEEKKRREERAEWRKIDRWGEESSNHPIWFGCSFFSSRASDGLFHAYLLSPLSLTRSFSL